MTPDETARLAAAAHALRPDWPMSSLRTFITDRYLHEPAHRLAVALVLCALDPTSQTPARLSENRAYWPAIDGTLSQPARFDPRSLRPAVPGDPAAGIAAARAELAKRMTTTDRGSSR